MEGGGVMADTPLAGFKSTEFAVTAGTVASMLLGLMPERYAPLAVGLAAVYAACRTLLKALHTAGLAKAVPDLPAVSAEVATAITDRGSK